MIGLILLGAVLAGGILLLARGIWHRLRSVPVSGWVLLPVGEKPEPALETQLWTLRTLRRQGRLSARVILLTDAMEPGQARFVQAALRQSLADEALCLDDLTQQMDEEMRHIG